LVNKKNMGDPQNEGSQDLEEKKLEDEALKDTPEDEVKGKIVEDLGLDEEADADLIGKLVSKELKGRKDLSTAIKQKRTWRDKAQTEPKPAEIPPKSEEIPPTEQPDLDKKLGEVLDKRDLDSLDVSDDTRKAIEFVMKQDKCTAKKAMESGIVKFHQGIDEEKAKAEEASISSSPKGQTAPIGDFMDKSPDELQGMLKGCDRLTEEGDKKFLAIKKALKERRL